MSEVGGVVWFCS